MRQTRRPDGRLIVREGDRPDAWYWLVTGVRPTFCIVGYLWGGDALKLVGEMAHGKPAALIAQRLLIRAERPPWTPPVWSPETFEPPIWK